MQAVTKRSRGSSLSSSVVHFVSLCRHFVPLLATLIHLAYGSVPLRGEVTEEPRREESGDIGGECKTRDRRPRTEGDTDG